MKIIGLCGKAGSGKDTVADYLVSVHDYTKLSFAGPLKAGVCAMFGWSPERLNDRVWKETALPVIGKSPREIMQTLGTEWGRKCVRNDLWLLLMLAAIEKEIEYTAHLNTQTFSANTFETRIVISDVRFENEAELIRAKGGTLYHIMRDVGSVAAHESEAGLSWHWSDYCVANKASKAELFQNVEDMICSRH